MFHKNKEIVQNKETKRLKKLLSSDYSLPPEINKAFKILDLNKNATLLDVEKSFRKLNVMYHPDRCKKENKTKCREKFVVEIGNAIKLLEDYFTNKYKPLYKKEK
jgi:DnaJ-class molecular chaperone